MRMPCSICGTYFTVKHPKDVKKPFACKSCDPPNGKPWTKEEVAALRRLRTTTTLSILDIAEILKRSTDSIETKIRMLRLKKPKKAETYGERKVVNGEILVKITRLNISRKKRKEKFRLVWMPLKDIAWYVHKGEIPEGYMVKIKDMKKPQDSIENLDLVLI